MSDVKRMPIKEFQELGFLQEANRQFFHPHGLALEIVVDDKTGDMRLGGVWDYRDDPEGIVFGCGIHGDTAEKAHRVTLERRRHADARARLFGEDANHAPFGDSHSDLPREALDIEPLDWMFPERSA